MVDGLQVTVRFLHILFGVAWVGGSLFYGHSVAGGLGKLEPSRKGPAMLAVQRKMVTFMGGAGILTLVFGVWNQYLIAGELAYQGGTWNVILGAALVLTLVMLAVGFGVQVPTLRKLEALDPPEGPPGDERAALVKRQKLGGIVITLTGVLVLLLMVVATGNRMGIA